MQINHTQINGKLIGKSESEACIVQVHELSGRASVVVQYVEYFH